MDERDEPESTFPRDDAGGALDAAPDGPYAAPDTGDAVVADEAAAPHGSLPLAILASLGVALAGIAVWAIAFRYTGRFEPAGVTVIAAIVIGVVMRRVSGRSTVVVRLIAALVAAVMCVVGSTAAAVSHSSSVFGTPYLTLLGDLWTKTFLILRDRDWRSQAIFAAAVLVAFLAASPPKEKAKDTDDEPAEDAPETPLEDPS